MYVLELYRFKEIQDVGDGNGATFSHAILRKEEEKLLNLYFVEPAGPDTYTPNKDRRIPQGAYNVVWDRSSKAGADIKGKLPILYNDDVEKERLIRIHVGNTGKDTLGCLCPGMNFNGAMVTESKKALTALLDIVFEKDFKVLIHNGE